MQRCHLRFCLLSPDPHVHLTEQGSRGGKTIPQEPEEVLLGPGNQEVPTLLAHRANELFTEPVGQRDPRRGEHEAGADCAIAQFGLDGFGQLLYQDVFTPIYNVRP
jgi:hypothetical protein